MPLHQKSQMQRNMSRYATEPGFSEQLQTPFKGAYYLFETAGRWWVRATALQVDPVPNTDPNSPKQFVENNPGIRESGDARRLSGELFIPEFPISGIFTNDLDANGGMIFIDTPEFTALPIRLYAGLERPWHVTAVYLTRVDDVPTRQLNTVILAINT